MATRTKQAEKRASLKLFDQALDYGVLARLTGFALRRASVIDFARFSEAIGDATITPLRFSLLELVGQNPGFQQVQLADALGLSRSAATVTIDYWEQRGSLERRPDPNDRRSYGIYLTREGETQLKRLEQLVIEHDRWLTRKLEPAERATLGELLEKICAR